MSFEFREFTPEEHITCTSVQDGLLNVMNTSDVGVLKRALAAEKSGIGRRTLIRGIESRIRKLQRRGVG